MLGDRGMWDLVEWLSDGNQAITIRSFARPMQFDVGSEVNDKRLAHSLGSQCSRPV